MFNNFFVTSIPTFIPDNHEFIENTYLNKSFLPAGSELFEFQEITVNEVEKILNTKKSNATGVDGINLKMLSYLMENGQHLSYSKK